MTVVWIAARKLLRSACAIQALLLCGFCANAAAAGCAAHSKEMTEASRVGRVEEAARLFRETEKSGACSSEILAPLAHNVAVAYGHAAFSSDKSDDERVRLLRAGLLFARPWRLVAGLADLEKAGQRFVEAATLYQEALDTISDETCTAEERQASSACREAAPPEALIRKIYKNAVETRLLSERYVAAPITRNGEPGGLARRSFRGFGPRVVALPVHFEFAKTEFTPEGRKAVADLLGYLTQQGSPPIHLIGHADERGTEAYNQKLSEERAGAVKRFLIEGGYQGTIRTTGRGKSQPFEADDPGSYTQEQRWQLDRRVELARQ